jgi:hypothetical protein
MVLISLHGGLGSLHVLIPMPFFLNQSECDSGYLEYLLVCAKYSKFLFYFSKGTEVEEVCNACGMGGHLLCCDTCPLLFHMECVVPPLKKVPRGKWSCPKCKMMKGE